MAESKQIGVTTPVIYRNVETGETVASVARTGSWFRSTSLVTKWRRERRIEAELEGVWRVMCWAFLHASTLGLAGSDVECTPEAIQDFLDRWDVSTGEADEGESPLGLTE